MTTLELLKAKQIGIAEARNGLTKILNHPRPYVITSTKDRRMFLLPYEDVIELIEILEESQDVVLRRKVKRARSDYRRTGGIPYNE